MTASTQHLTLQAGGGRVQAVLDSPQGPAKGLAVVAHPHPLYGGTMDNKVVQTLAKACLMADWTCLRFNFRGVGDSEGVYDAGRGEAQDLLQLISQWPPQTPLVLAGFSFGAFVACQALQALWPSARVQKILLVGTAVTHFDAPALPPEALDRVLALHGELDDTVPLSAMMDWARPQQLPVMVLPGAGHFFHGKLPQIKALAVRHLSH